MRVAVGRIGKPHGIRGEVTIVPMTDEPDQRFAPGSAFLREGGHPLEVAASRWHAGTLLIKFVGCNDRNSAELLRGSILEVERDAADTPEDPAEFYDSSLIGCQVYDQVGDLVGEVIDVLHLPSQDLLVVEGSGREILIPFVHEMVPIVDIGTQRIVIDPPEGLLSMGTEGEGAGDGDLKDQGHAH